MVLQGYYKGVTRAFSGCYECVTRDVRGTYKGVTSMGGQRKAFYKHKVLNFSKIVLYPFFPTAQDMMWMVERFSNYFGPS
jgi:hypothetical protein